MKGPGLDPNRLGNRYGVGGTQFSGIFIWKSWEGNAFRLYIQSLSMIFNWSTHADDNASNLDLNIDIDVNEIELDWQWRTQQKLDSHRCGTASSICKEFEETKSGTAQICRRWCLQSWNALAPPLYLDLCACVCVNECMCPPVDAGSESKKLWLWYVPSTQSFTRQILAKTLPPAQWRRRRVAWYPLPSRRNLTTGTCRVTSQIKMIKLFFQGYG